MNVRGTVREPPGCNCSSQTPPPSFHSHPLLSKSSRPLLSKFRLCEKKQSNKRKAKHNKLLTQKSLTIMEKETKQQATNNERQQYTEHVIIEDVQDLSLINEDFAQDANRSKRLQFVIDKEIEGINKRQEPCKVNAFGLSIKRIVEQCGKSIPLLKLAKIKALGREVNPQIIALAMVNAELDITRTLYEKGENVPDYDNKPTTQDIWVTSITKCVPHIDTIFQTEIMELLKTAPALVTTTQTGAPTTFQVAGL